MTTTIEFKSDTAAQNILRRLDQWGYEIVETETGYWVEHKSVPLGVSHPTVVPLERDDDS